MLIGVSKNVHKKSIRILSLCILSYYRVFYNALREIKLKYCQQGLSIGLKIGYVHVPQVEDLFFLPLEERLNVEAGLHSLEHIVPLLTLFLP